MQRRMPERHHTQQVNNRVKKTAKNMRVFAFVMCLIVIALIWGFSRHKNSEPGSEDVTKTQTEADKLIAKDLEVGYPATPSEVVKLFGRMNQCLYNTALDENQFMGLLNQVRMLYSEELLAKNSLQEQKDAIHNEVEQFREMKKKIVNYTVDKASSVKYKTVKKKKCAYLEMAYFMSGDGKYYKSFQDYVLVKEGKRWKILAFRLNNEKHRKKTDTIEEEE